MTVPVRCTDQPSPPPFSHSTFLHHHHHHRARLRAPPTTSNPRVGPTRFPSLPHPSRNEQRAISLLLNACHKSPRATPCPASPLVHRLHLPPAPGPPLILLSISLPLSSSLALLTFPLRAPRHGFSLLITPTRFYSFFSPYHDLVAPLPRSVLPLPLVCRPCPRSTRRTMNEEEIRVQGEGVKGKRHGTSISVVSLFKEK